MNTVQQCDDTSDAEVLSQRYELYLKPIARLHISVQLPSLKTNGKSISNWEIMEKIRSLSKPDEFIYMKVVKSSLEFVRFEAELESRHQIKGVLAKLDQRTIKLSGFPDVLKMRACEAKSNFPQKHDWDSFFRDARNMNEMKPGERPDTVHMMLLPSKWFSKSARQGSKPDEDILREVFETFGPIRCIDVPVLDAYRSRILAVLNEERKSFNFGEDAHFEAFVQYEEYMGFVKCMTALRGMKLLYKEEGKAWTALIQADFDKTKHLSEASIKKRKSIREKLIQEDLEKEREERRRKELEELKRQAELRRLEEEKEREREEERIKLKEKKKKRKELRKKKLEEKLKKNIALEERKLLVTQRKLESIRLLDFLLGRVKVEIQKEEAQRKEDELLKELEKMQKKKAKKERKKAEKEKKEQLSLEEKEKEIRSRLIKKYTQLEEKRLEEQRETLRRTVETSSTKLRSVVTTAKSERRTNSGCSTTDVTLSDDSEPATHSGSDRAAYRRTTLKSSDSHFGARRSRSRSRSPHRSGRHYSHRRSRQPSNSYSDYYSAYDRYFSRISENSSRVSARENGEASHSKASTSSGVRPSSVIHKVVK